MFSSDDDGKDKGKDKNGNGGTDSDSDSDSDGASLPKNLFSGTIVPSKVGIGDEAPRMPHVMALPVINRPLFPGVITPITITEPATIDAIEALQEAQQQSASYVSVFLRKKHPNGVSDGGVLLPTPEVITDPSDLYQVGTFAQIQRLTKGVGSIKSPSPFGSDSHHDGDENATDDASAAATVLLLAHRRVDLVSVDELGPPIDATISHWPRLDYTGSDGTIKALTNEIFSTIREVAQHNPLFRESVQFYSMRLDVNDPYKLADFTASICSVGEPEDLQAVLEEKDPEMRLHKALVLLTKEREVARLQKEISAKVEEKMSEQQRRYFLTEQLKSIKKELGMERDDKDAVIEKYQKKLASYKDIPEEAMSVINAELEKLSTLEMNSSEYSVTRNYLDWLVGIPWSVYSDENFDINKARQILDRDHYGLDDVKDTILEFIAVGKLRGSVQGKILCLSGPPGTGKTSIAKSVADSLGRKFFRFSVGGLSGTAEITGHRRTYLGSMPGKIIQCLKTTETMNPVILIDEIDKLGHSYQGDPASALLEVLDPSQNSSFRDHYVDLPVDISKVLFMCTANELERIPGPLLDRMEVVQLSGYDLPEKVEIANQYLVPKSMKANGLMVDKEAIQEAGEATSEKVKEEKEEGHADNDDDDAATSADGGTGTASGDTDTTTTTTAVYKTPLDSMEHAPHVPSSVGIEVDAIENLARWYSREAGVRSLSKYIDKITRKLALQVVAENEGTTLTEKSRRKENDDNWLITADKLKDYVGKQIFTSDRLYNKDPLPNGIVMGLAYTSMGGSALYIETQAVERGLDDDGKTRGGGGIKVTGNLGDTMKESSQIAYTVARAHLFRIDPKNSYFDKHDIHMHVPEGATPKDGPSAGIAMVSSKLSLAMGKPIRNDLAMTGEISLTGKVLPVGGIKEKIMGGRRAGVNTIIFPKANERDYDEIPDYLKEGLSVHFADEYEDVYKVVFGES